MTGKFLELGDILVDFPWFHGQLFKLDSRTIGSLGVLELVFEFRQEVVPYGWDVLGIRVECFYPVSHVARPSSNFWSLDEGEGE
jgi:hypothetical protein